MKTNNDPRTLLVAALAGSLAVSACGDNASTPIRTDHGPIAPNISAPLGEIIPSATDEQRAAFERGRNLALKRFSLGEGVGPSFNVTFCASCHEKPTIGGGAGLYRNFFLAFTEADGEVRPSNTPTFDCDNGAPEVSSDGAFSGVLRVYSHSSGHSARPEPGTNVNLIAQRNPIPFFGVGLLAELSNEELLKRENLNEDDLITGRANFDGEFVGRFGVKAQTQSIEGFIRGPLLNHMGITTDPLSNEQRSRLPVDSSDPDLDDETAALLHMLSDHAQVAAPISPNCDLDDVADPELSTDDLFDLVSFSMLLAAPEIEPLTDQTRRGLMNFDAAGCDQCHAPRLHGPKGPLPVYSDLLLHDMGPGLADGLVFGAASGSEFRTQPLWGVAAAAPYLHDGRAPTIHDAIMWHGGEATLAVEHYKNMTSQEQTDLIEFLMSLGGRQQASAGLIPGDETPPAAGEAGGPIEDLSAEDSDEFYAGRDLFDHEFGYSEGIGSFRFNGDSCRACHFEPAIGGAGPRGVNVMRHGFVSEEGEFTAPRVGTILHKETTLTRSANFPQLGANVYEHRQTPSLLGAGLIDGIPEVNITANADPDDLNGDDISGRVSLPDGTRVGRFGWKAQVPSLAEFVRDAVGAELGMTLDAQEGLTYGVDFDEDAIADPEMTPMEAQLLEAFMARLAPPARKLEGDAAAIAAGETVFESVGCASCHIPTLQGASGDVALYSDLLLHEILPPTAKGIEDLDANMWEFRTAPLWGISDTAPYMHSGAADTLEQAILLHDGEAVGVREAYEALSSGDKAALQAFLESL